jgi:RimJ/RimL family protein N-acetyltransferase
VTIPELETRRLLLRDALMADPIPYEKNFADYEVIRQLAAAVPWPYPPGGVADFLEKLRPDQGKTRWTWTIHLKAEPAEPIGNVDLFRDRAIENRGFWLARKHWGQGYMTEATNAVTDYAFNVLCFETLILSNALGNNRSRRIKEKAGAVLLRTEPAQFNDPIHTQREVWELTKSAWETRARPLYRHGRA